LSQAFTKGLRNHADGSQTLDVDLGLVKRFTGFYAEHVKSKEEWRNANAAKGFQEVEKGELKKVGESSKPKANEASKEKAAGKEVKVVEKVKAAARSTATVVPKGAGKKTEVVMAAPPGKKGEGEKVEKEKEPMVKKKRAREEEEQTSEVEVVESGAKGKSKGKETPKKKPRREEEFVGSGSEEEKKKRVPKPKRQRDGGYMSVPKKRAVLSPSVVASDEEVPRPKRKQKKKAQAVEEKPVSNARGKRKTEPVEDVRAPRKKSKQEPESDAKEDEDEDRDEHSENDDDEEEKKAPIEIARARGGKKKPLPKGESKELPQFVEVEDKCALCAKNHDKCIWTIEAIKKSGAKACTRCNAKKTGCVPGFKNSGPVVLDMRTALGELVDSIAPIPSSSRGLPRAGVVGDSTEHPTSIGQLLVEVLNTARAVREENQELRSEVNNISGTLGMMVNYDNEHRRELVKELASMLAQAAAPPSPHYAMSSHIPPRTSLDAMSLPRPSVSPLVRFSPLDRPSPQPLPEVSPLRDASAVPEPLAALPLPPLVPLLLPELDIPDLPPILFSGNDTGRTPSPIPPRTPAASQPDPPNPASSASRAGAVGKESEDEDEDAEGEEDKDAPIPSAVAQRTRLQTKPATKPVSGDDEDEGSSGESHSEIPKGPPLKKRKGPRDAEDGGDDAPTKKKAKPAAKKSTKGKAPAKKAN
jgi:hypothetical protein